MTSSDDWLWGGKLNFTERWINERTSGQDAKERWENDDWIKMEEWDLESVPQSNHS